MAAKKAKDTEKEPVREKKAANSEEARLKALEHALADLDKQFGKGSVMKLGDAPTFKVDVVPTGCITLDAALGVGGLPRGRITEIFGQESSGKTTVALHVIAEAQKHGGICAFVDAEHALDPVYAAKLGVNVSELYVSQPDTGEQALEIVEGLVRSGALDVIVVDSVAALVPKAEIEGEMGTSFVGVQARLMSQALRKLTGTISKTGTVAIFINQLRDTIAGPYGGPTETTPGGRALKFYSSVRLEVRNAGRLKNGDVAVGNHVKVKAVKNKVAPPFKTAEFDIIFGEGISKEGTLLDLAMQDDVDIIHKNGGWFSFKGKNVAQGRDNTRVYMKEHPEVLAEVEAAVRQKLFGDLPEAPADSAETEAAEAVAEGDALTEEDSMSLLDMAEDVEEDDATLIDMAVDEGVSPEE